MSEAPARRVAALPPWLFNVVVLACYVALVAFSTARHEMWEDEYQAWVLAREATSLFDLYFHVMRYEGHPGLWHLLLYGLNLFTDDPVAMQALHVLLAAVSMAVLLWCAPFRPGQRALMAFGYVLCYEFAVIARCYVLSVLCMGLCCAALCGRRPRPMVVGITLAGLYNTSFYSLLLGGGLAVYWLSGERETLRRPGPARRALLAGIAAAGFGLVLAGIQMRPPPDHQLAKDQQTGRFSLDRALLALEQPTYPVLFPLPPDELHWWQENVIEDLGAPMRAAAAVLFVGLAWTGLRGRPRSLALLLVTHAGVALATVMIYRGWLRHQASVYLALLAAYWLAVHADRRDPAPTETAAHQARFRQLALTILLAAQVPGAIRAHRLDALLPFSGLPSLLAWIQTELPPDAILATGPRQFGPGIAAELHREVYFLSEDRYGTYMVFEDPGDTRLLWIAEMAVHVAHDLANRKQQRVVVLVSNLAEKLPPKTRLLTSDSASITEAEDWAAYLTEPDDAAAAPAPEL